MFSCRKCAKQRALPIGKRRLGVCKFCIGSRVRVAERVSVRVPLRRHDRYHHHHHCGRRDSWPPPRWPTPNASSTSRVGNIQSPRSLASPQIAFERPTHHAEPPHSLSQFRFVSNSEDTRAVSRKTKPTCSVKGCNSRVPFRNRLNRSIEQNPLFLAVALIRRP